MNKERIYFDHAATTAVRPEVLSAMLPILENIYGNPSSFYDEGAEAYQYIQTAREQIAELLEVSPDEIFFTSGGTESDNWALKGTAIAKRKQGKHLITTKIEHHAVLHSMQALERIGYEVSYLDVDGYGLVDPKEIEAAIRPDTILVSVMTANNEIGTTEPIEEIAAICKEKQVIFHSDGVQALGAIPVKPRELNVDLMSFSGHKFYAPKGVGIMYIRKGVKIVNLIDGGAQEKRQRAGTENTAFAVGIAKALELALMDLPEEARRQTALRDRLIRELMTKIPYCKLNGHYEKRLPNNINLSFEFIEGESILLLLNELGYMCSSGSACTSGSLDPSHVLMAIGLPHEIAHGSLRITLGRENTDSDIDRMISDLPGVIEKLRRISPLYADFKQGKINNIIPEQGANLLKGELRYEVQR
ncbi:MAG TPA: cysteine desulfurase NifS [Corynebacteriales bacterium]|jgi:cysteine desulfurase|nr:cysteine desulfurase NifS [Clostridiaceae bacterium]HHY08770.1 cysteine desulfurase NifS [Mycobacteriales bacterium]